MKPNSWMVISEAEQKDTEFLKYSLRGDGYEVSYILYTRVQPEVYFPIVQMVTFQVPADVINYMEKKPEEVMNDLVLDALSYMNEHGIVFNAKTMDNALIILESLGIYEFAYNLR